MLLSFSPVSSPSSLVLTGFDLQAETRVSFPLSSLFARVFVQLQRALANPCSSLFHLYQYVNLPIDPVLSAWTVHDIPAEHTLPTGASDPAPGYFDALQRQENMRTKSHQTSASRLADWCDQTVGHTPQAVPMSSAWLCCLGEICSSKEEGQSKWNAGSSGFGNAAMLKLRAYLERNAVVGGFRMPSLSTTFDRISDGPWGKNDRQAAG